MSKKGGEGISVRRKIPNPRPNGTKDKDEDLLLFRELHKHEKDRGVSLLTPVSDEFEAHGYAGISGMAPAGKKGAGYDALAEGGKNDYDWLKTPPATPLFPSLEMENGPELVTQREIPIVQPLTRFAGNLMMENGSVRPSKSTNSKPNVPARYSTPSERSKVSTPEKKNVKSAPLMIQKSYTDLNLETTKKGSSAQVIPVNSKEPDWNLLATNLSKSKSLGTETSNKPTKQKSRGVSPAVRSKIPAQHPELSDETPSNLRTDRSSSAYRRHANANQQNSSVSRKQPESPAVRSKLPGQNRELSDEAPSNLRTDRSSSAYRGRTATSEQNPSVSQRRPESVTKTRRKSRSPTTSRNRKQEASGNSGPEKDRTQQGNRTQVLGSRMLDRFLNSRMSTSEDWQSKIKLNSSMNQGSDARKPSIEERPNTTKFNTSMNEGSGFGRLMSKSALDMALRHTEFPRDSVAKTRDGIIAGRRSVSVSKRTTSGL